MASKNNFHKILLAGGGTGGSVTPLLAVYDELTTAGGFEFLWLGGRSGPEREMVERAGIKFKAIVGGKWRRYFSWKNLVDIFKIKIGFFQAFFIMLRWRPNLVMSAGSFISVPVVWAAWLLRVPVIIHQQDVIPGLANKLMAPFAKIVTVTFETSLKDYGGKAVWTGNPVRSSLEVKNPNVQFSNLNHQLPVVLILGGGTGSMAINRLVEESLVELTKFCQIIHLTGKGKMAEEAKSDNYVSYEFLDAEKMAAALKLADLVVTRAGLGFLSELAALGKPAIIIPMPETHQEANAAYFQGREAAIVLKQADLTATELTHKIKSLVADKEKLARLSESMGSVMKSGAGLAMAKIIKDILSLG